MQVRSVDLPRSLGGCEIVDSKGRRDSHVVCAHALAFTRIWSRLGHCFLRLFCFFFDIAILSGLAIVGQ